MDFNEVQGYTIAVKEIFPEAKVIVHLQNGYNNAAFRRLFGGLEKAGRDVVIFFT